MASNSQQNVRERRLVLVGKTGSGKSSLGNTFFDEKVFKTDHSPSSGTSICESRTKEVMNTLLTLVDTPGLFDTEKSEEELKPTVCKSIVECAPGPHAFLIVLRVDKFSPQEEEILTKICQYFSKEVLTYSVIVFTHGDQLEEGTTIHQFVVQNQKLKDLVRKCGGRCHVFDSKHWKNNDPEKYRSNSYQLKELLSTVEGLLIGNSCYTNKMLQEADRQIRTVANNISMSERNVSPEEARERAKHERTLIYVQIMKRHVSYNPLTIFLGSRFEEFHSCMVTERPTPTSSENVTLIHVVNEEHSGCHIL